MQKILESDHYKIVIVNSSDDIPKSDGIQGNIRILATLPNEECSKTTFYLNSEYYNTKEALAYGLSSAIIRNTVDGVLFYEEEEKDFNKRSFFAGVELIDLLKQL